MRRDARLLHGPGETKSALRTAPLSHDHYRSIAAKRRTVHSSLRLAGHPDTELTVSSPVCEENTGTSRTCSTTVLQMVANPCASACTTKALIACEARRF